VVAGALPGNVGAHEAPAALAGAAVAKTPRAFLFQEK
jgi:hypothetical protein